MMRNLSDGYMQGIGHGSGWWAVYTRHHHEHAIKDILVAKGLDVFLPTFGSPRQWKDRRKIVSMPLFPCYLFVREYADGRLPILTTPGVHMILTRGERFAIIPDDDIQNIKRAAEEPSRVEPHPYLHCGERVRVVRGPMQGVSGILLRRKGNCRLVVSVELLAQSAAIEVGDTDLAPMESDRPPGLYADHGFALSHQVA